ncbi:MAG: hypothetical protein ABL964_11030 [Steroidobacteraceae bacterium]
MSTLRDPCGMTLMAVAMLLPLGAGTAASAPPQPKVPVPADFLEYLAVLEGADDNWTDFEVAEAPPPPANSRKAAPKAAKAVESK